VFAIIAVVVLALLTVFQLTLIAGAPLGHFAWGGAHRVLPVRLRVSSVVSIVLYAVIAIVLLERAGVTGLFDLPAAAQVAAWVVFAYFALGVVLNAVSRSVRERAVMVPVAAALAVLSLLVALGV
jgi:hypothetical protein